MSDARFSAALQETEEWADLQLLFKDLEELDARAFVLAMPFNNQFFSSHGVSQDSLAGYYRRLRATAAQYGLPIMTFEKHAGDNHFFDDLGDHLSPEGWIYYDRALDAFYHDALQVDASGSVQLPSLGR